MVQFIESELQLLKNEITEMWDLVYSQLQRSGKAVLNCDKALAQTVLLRERRVNTFELKIDSDVEDIIALYNPLAIDLRFVLAMLKINTNLERIGDFAEGISRFIIKCGASVVDDKLMKEIRFEEMFTEVLEMLDLAKHALLEEKIDIATSIFPKDNVLDEINANSVTVLANYMRQHPESAEVCLDLIGIIRKLERAGDHITNIAEEIVFYIDAKVLKHRGRLDENEETK